MKISEMQWYLVKTENSIQMDQTCGNIVLYRLKCILELSCHPVQISDWTEEVVVYRTNIDAHHCILDAR